MTSIGSCRIHGGRTSGFGLLFRDALLKQHPALTEAGLRKAQAFNFKRYYFQGIGRYAPYAVYDAGSRICRHWPISIPTKGYTHGPQPTSIDAAIYGFIANIHFYEIETPALGNSFEVMKNIVRHCCAIHDAVGSIPHDRDRAGGGAQDEDGKPLGTRESCHVLLQRSATG